MLMLFHGRLVPDFTCVPRGETDKDTHHGVSAKPRRGRLAGKLEGDRKGERRRASERAREGARGRERDGGKQMHSQMMEVGDKRLDVRCNAATEKHLSISSRERGSAHGASARLSLHLW